MLTHLNQCARHFCVCLQTGWARPCFSQNHKIYRASGNGNGIQTRCDANVNFIYLLKRSFNLSPSNEPNERIIAVIENVLNYANTSLWIKAKKAKDGRNEHKEYSYILPSGHERRKIFSLKVVLSIIVVLTPFEWIYARYTILDPIFPHITTSKRLLMCSACEWFSRIANKSSWWRAYFLLLAWLAILFFLLLQGIAYCARRDQIDIKSFYIVYFACGSQKCHCIPFFVVAVACFVWSGVWLALYVYCLHAGALSHTINKWEMFSLQLLRFFGLLCAPRVNGCACECVSMCQLMSNRKSSKTITIFLHRTAYTTPTYAFDAWNRQREKTTCNSMAFIRSSLIYAFPWRLR